MTPLAEAPARIGLANTMKLLGYGGSLLALVWLMGVLRLPAMAAAQQVFVGLFIFLSVTYFLEPVIFSV